MKITILSILILFLSFLSIAQDCPDTNNAGIHIVQKGETLYAISKKYSITVADILTWNNLSDKEVISICQQLKIIDGAGQAPVLSPKSGFVNYQKQATDYHIVQSGQQLEKIAELYGYTLKRFRNFNNLLPGEQIVVGQKLKSTDCVCPAKGMEDQTPITDTNTTTMEASKVAPKAKSNPDAPLKFNTNNIEREPEIEAPTPTAATSDSAPSLADGANYLKDEEKDMLTEINLLRANPAGYVKYIESYVTELRNRNSYGTAIQSAQELINELKNTPTLSTLAPTECLYQAAMKHGEDRRKAGSNDHVGTDGSWPWDRVRRACPQLTDGNENLVGGPEDVRKAIILLLVDDGISSRGHRKTLLNPKWKYAACYKIGKVGFMPNSWVQKFAF